MVETPLENAYTLVNRARHGLQVGAAQAHYDDIAAAARQLQGTLSVGVHEARLSALNALEVTCVPGRIDRGAYADFKKGMISVSFNEMKKLSELVSKADLKGLDEALRQSKAQSAIELLTGGTAPVTDKIKFYNFVKTTINMTNDYKKTWAIGLMEYLKTKGVFLPAVLAVVGAIGATWGGSKTDATKQA